MKAFCARHRRALSELAHGLLAIAALGASILLPFDFAPSPPAWRALAAALAVAAPLKFAAFRVFGLRDLAWRYLGFTDLGRIAAASAAASLAAGAGLRLAFGGAFPRPLIALDFLLCLAFLCSAHVAARMLREGRRRPARGAARPKKIFIYGAGEAGLTVLSEIRAYPELGYRVAGFLDDDPHKAGMRLHGVQVLGGRPSLGALVAAHRVEEVLLALPRATGGEITAIVDACRAARVATRKIPPLAELLEDRVLVGQAREVRLEDLLGRPAVRLDQDLLEAWLRGRTVLVTGAGGSIGSELCRQIARFEPAVLAGLDHAETALYEIDQEMRDRFPNVAFCPEVANIQNVRRIAEVFARHRPSIVFHAAAYKHVPLMEAHVLEALENNVFGTRVVAREAARRGVETFVLVSSDKAVRPVSVMGATKRLAELVCQAAGESGTHTRFLAARFGNVLGSNGSVIPRFRRQIAEGGPVTVTHPDMRRYFMTIPEAAQLLLEAGAMGSGGEIFVLEMGASIRIVDLARKLIVLSGYRPDADIRIEFCGMRPGERLAEELQAIEEQTVATHHAQIRIFAGQGAVQPAFEGSLQLLERAVERRDASRALLCLTELIPDYNPSGILRLALRNPTGKTRAAGSVA